MYVERSVRQDNIITVVANGEYRARANIAHVVLEIRTRGGTAAEALKENDRRERAVRARLRGLGVHEESTEISGVSFLPASGDGITPAGAMEAQGFVAVRALGVNVFIGEDDMGAIPARVAHLLDEAAEAGAQAGIRQQVNLAIFRSPCVTYGLENDRLARHEALRQAMASARTAGEEMAHSLHMELGAIVSTQVLELGSLVQGRWSSAAFGVPGLDTPRPGEAGRVNVRATVSVSFRVHSIPPAREPSRLEAGHFTLERADSTAPGHPDHTPEFG